MKKYFTKWLPAEGGGNKLFLCSRDIKYGDNAYSPRNEFYVFGTVENSYENESIKVIGEISFGAGWLKGGEELTDEEIKIKHQVTFKKENVLKEGQPKVWQHETESALYWKWYETMDYFPEKSSAEFIIGHQNGVECKVPHNICIDKTLVKIKCPTCGTYH